MNNGIVSNNIVAIFIDQEKITLFITTYKTRSIQSLNETCYFYCLFTKGGRCKVFFKTKVCRNKLHIYPEVVVWCHVFFNTCPFSVAYGKVPFSVNDDENDFGVARDRWLFI